MDTAAAAAARKRRGAAVTALATRASSYASSSNSPSDADSTVSSPTYFSSLSLANASVQTAASYSSSAATTIRTATCQVPSGMGISTQAAPAQCYRSVEEPTLHEDYDELEMHHSVSEEAHSSYYNYSYDPEEDCGEVGSIL